LHPWLTQCLLAGLAAESETAHRDADEAVTLWDGLFEAVHAAQPGHELGHRLFRDLVQSKFDVVVADLVERFDQIEHASWVRLLDHATTAPCRLPVTEPFEVSYRRLAPDHVPGRGAVQAAVTSLTALLWLTRN